MLTDWHFVFMWRWNTILEALLHRTWLEQKVNLWSEERPSLYRFLHAVVLQCAIPPCSWPMCSGILFHTLWTPLSTGRDSSQLDFILKEETNQSRFIQRIQWRCFHADFIIKMNTCSAESSLMLLCVWCWMMHLCEFIHHHEHTTWRVRLCSHVSWQMFPEPLAVSPVMPCPVMPWPSVTFEGQCTSLAVYEALPFINMPPGSVIWYLH